MTCRRVNNCLFVDMTFYRYCGEKPGNLEKGVMLNSVKRRLYNINRVREAERIGILVSTLSTDKYLDAVDRIKKLCKLWNKRSYIFSFGKISPEKLANFPEVCVSYPWIFVKSRVVDVVRNVRQIQNRLCSRIISLKWNTLLHSHVVYNVSREKGFRNGKFSNFFKFEYVFLLCFIFCSLTFIHSGGWWALSTSWSVILRHHLEYLVKSPSMQTDLVPKVT